MTPVQDAQAIRLPGNEMFPLQYFCPLETHDDGTDIISANLSTNEKIRGFVGGLWHKTAQAMIPEQDRMKRCELYYAGRHYHDPLENMEKEVTNLAFSQVESVWPELTMDLPRPEVVPGYGMTDKNAYKLNQWATWLMDTNGFNAHYRMACREMLKLGWNVGIITFDWKTGMPYPKGWSNFDFYPDFTATHEHDMMYYFLAGPVSTGYLRSLFPEYASLIHPDNYVSPGFDVYVRPYLEAANARGTWFYDSSLGVQPYAQPPAGPAVPGTTSWSPAAGVDPRGNNTTFLLQLFFRDLTQKMTVYYGRKWMRHQSGEWTWTMGYLQQPTVAVSSGWRVAQMTSSGVVLSVHELDPAFAGLNFVMGRDYEQQNRMFSPGEIDNIISINRAVNHRKALLNSALGYETTPIFIMDSNTGISSAKRSIVPGEVLRRKPGTKIEVLPVRAPVEQQFAMLDRDMRDSDTVSGFHDPLKGKKPPGVESGIAIQRLQTQGASRILGKQGARADYLSQLVRKLMVGAALKLNRAVQFTATNGELITVDPEIVLSNYDIRMAIDSGLPESRNDRKSEAIQLAGLGALDQPALLEAFNWPDRGAILARMEQAQVQMAQAQGAGAAAKGGPQRGAPPKGAPQKGAQ
jgi:hypothetical protein